jgi:ABC-type transporter Mla subunit MlaD
MASRLRTAAVITATLLTLTAAVGCGALDKALDCVQTADAIAGNVDDLQQAVSAIGDDPGQVDRTLGDIDKELDQLKDNTDNADLSKAVDDLGKAVDNVRTAVDKGDTTPDLAPVTDAAGEIGKICTS